MAQAELDCISPVQNHMTVYTLHFGSSKVSRSSSISVPFDILRFASQLPTLPREVQRILITNRDYLNTLHSAVVRKKFVFRGLLLKIKNDPTYREIRVDTSLAELLPENAIGEDAIFIVLDHFLSETTSRTPDISGCQEENESKQTIRAHEHLHPHVDVGIDPIEFDIQIDIGYN